MTYTAELHTELANSTIDKGGRLWNLADEGDVQGVVQYIDAITSILNENEAANKTDSTTDDQLIQDRQKVGLSPLWDNLNANDNFVSIWYRGFSYFVKLRTFHHYGSKRSILRGRFFMKFAR